MSKRLLYIKLIIIGFLSLLLIGKGSLSLSAQNIEVEAPRTVLMGQNFRVHYQLKNLKPISNPQEPIYKGLELIFGPAVSQSSSYSNINGHATSETKYTYTYTFIADKVGSFHIKGFSVETKKGKLKARDITVKVLAPSKKGIENTETSTPILRSSLSKKSIYQHEAISISHKLYFDNFRFRYDPPKPLSYEDFITEDVPLDGNNSLDKEKLNGSVYNVLDLSKQIIIPQKTGIIDLPTLETNIYIPLPSEDEFFSSSGERRIKLKAKTLKLEVLPLPEEDRPMDFSGAVGDFRLFSEFKYQEDLKSNKAYVLKLHIEGEGNLKSATLPKVNFPSTFEVYPATTVQKLFYNKTNNTICSSADIEYSFIPRSKGSFEIPALSFHFFNPKTKEYEYAKTKAIKLEVKEGEKVDTEGIIQEENFSNSLLSKYRKDIGATSFEGLSLLNIWYFLSYFLIILLTVIIILSLLRYRSLRQDVVGFKSRKANAIAIKRLKLTKSYADKEQADAFYEELLRALWGYVSDKFRMPASMLSRENIQDLFERKGFEQNVTESYCQLLDELEFARYAPKQGERQLQDLYSKAVDLISMIEKSK